MTIEEKLKKMMFDHGLFEGQQCNTVMDRVKADDVNEAMTKRWGDEAEGHPDVLFTALWMSVRHHACEYIDETCPGAWFRPMFAD